MATFDSIVGRLRAAAEPTRLRLLKLLQSGEFNVKDLTQLLGQSQPRVSRHIKLLAEAGLIERQQEGSWVFVRASADPGVREFVGKALCLIDEDDAQVVRDAERARQIRSERAFLAQSYFNANAEQWDRIRSLHAPEPEVEAAMLDALGAGPFDLLLDLGAGTGRLLELFSGRAQRLIGIDSNREMLKCARVRIDEASLANCSVRLADIYDLPFPDASADAAVIHQVLHFLETPKRALAEAARVLKPEGRLLVVDFAPHSFEFLREEHAHVRLGFGSAEIESWLKEAGMEAVRYSELRADDGGGKKLTVALWFSLKSNAAERASPPRWKVA